MEEGAIIFHATDIIDFMYLFLNLFAVALLCFVVDRVQPPTNETLFRELSNASRICATSDLCQQQLTSGNTTSSECSLETGPISMFVEADTGACCVLRSSTRRQLLEWLWKVTNRSTFSLTVWGRHESERARRRLKGLCLCNGFHSGINVHRAINEYFLVGRRSRHMY
jgi:hypothetical protein